MGLQVLVPTARQHARIIRVGLRQRVPLHTSVCRTALFAQLLFCVVITPQTVNFNFIDITGPLYDVGCGGQVHGG